MSAGACSAALGVQGRGEKRSAPARTVPKRRAGARVPQLRVRMLSGAVVYEGLSFPNLEALRAEVARGLARPEELVFCRGDAPS